MEVNFVAKHGTVPADVQATIEQKVIKLPRFFDRATSIQVVVDLVHASEPKVEIIVSAANSHDFVAADTGHNVVAATDKAIEKMEKQLRKHKERVTEHRGREDRRTDTERGIG